jgi:hypothetical protein
LRVPEVSSINSTLYKLYMDRIKPLEHLLYQATNDTYRNINMLEGM